MTQDQWQAVDGYISDLLVAEDEALTEALAASAAAGLPAINVAPNQGKLLHLLAQTQGARTALEIGTLGGYSTIWLARALPEDGRLISLEYDPAHAEVARANIARAGLAKIAEVRTGAALETLPRIAAEPGAGPFDLVFIDADKRNNPRYVEWALRLTRPGSLIIVDNVVRGGGVVDATSEDPSILGTREMFELVAREPRLDATALQTVGVKGYDGLLVARVIA
ncbi:O-methyltransferase [Streptomyces pristinaespiralis]|uniref:O-methyltransferase n=2 Tax=Streptomyces pristinaespiralis TaxID=38300 RepID=B5HBJ6_STRE2|nr:O-methyltransferase [Streptomyces pristinaespiralis]ALC23467.1 O-methyltransferase [Streptomyces pristinaespiralis]EDY64207.1 O-methyltransferase [Streptomyces pristinaespiralis ATCC 25486]QMU14061.1 O-methyltransferase [Streptomyces pristinaespiralis]